MLPQLLALPVFVDHPVNPLNERRGQLDRGQGLFLFTDMNLFLADPDPLVLPWQSARPGQAVRLIDR